MVKNPKSDSFVLRDRASTAKIHALLIPSGILGHGNASSQLISSYARIDYLKLARKVFDTLPHRGIDSWNAVIIAYLRQDSSAEVIDLYKQMNLAGIRPYSSTFTVALKACTSLLDSEMGEKIRRTAAECGYDHDVFVGSSVLNLYVKCEKMDEAFCAFDKMQKRDLVTF